MNKNKVLFLCTGNTARSQMAETFLRRYGSERFEAYSAGIEPGEINPYVRRVMAEIGMDLKGQYSKSVEEYIGKMHFGYLITVCSEAEKRCPIVFPGIGQRLHWYFEDPAAFVGSEEETLNQLWTAYAQDEREAGKRKMKPAGLSVSSFALPAGDRVGLPVRTSEGKVVMPEKGVGLNDVLHKDHYRTELGSPNYTLYWGSLHDLHDVRGRKSMDGFVIDAFKYAMDDWDTTFWD